VPSASASQYAGKQGLAIRVHHLGRAVCKKGRFEHCSFTYGQVLAVGRMFNRLHRVMPVTAATSGSEDWRQYIDQQINAISPSAQNG